MELKKVFEADYEMKLHFQSKFSKESSTSGEPEESADSIKLIKANKIDSLMNEYFQKENSSINFSGLFLDEYCITIKGEISFQEMKKKQIDTPENN